MASPFSATTQNIQFDHSHTDDIFFGSSEKFRARTSVSQIYTTDVVLPVTQIQNDLLKTRNFIVTQWTNKKIVFSGTSLDVAWVRATWNAVAAHNSILRTAIHKDEESGNYVQSVLQSARPIEVQDASIETVAPPSSAKDLADLIPRAVLQHDENASIFTLILWFQRILFDDYSFTLIEDDFNRFYRGVSFRERIPLRSYLEHAEKQQDREKSLVFWKSTFNEAVMPKLPYGPASEKADRKVLFVETSEDVTSGLDYVEKTTGLPRAAILEALWAVILARHCAAESVAFAVSDRDTSFSGSRKVAGYLSQLFPMNVDINSQQSVLELARNAASFKQNASQHACLSYGEITEQLSSECNVQTFIRYVEDSERATSLLHGHTFPVEVYLKDTGALKASVFFDGYLGADKVRLTLQHFFTLLEEFVQDPSAPIDELECISFEEKEFLLAQGQSAKEPTPSLVHQLFEQQAEISPNATAAQFEQSSTISFNGLNKLANSLARTLPQNAGAIIPVCMDVSIEFVASLLAIMKSGNAYVTLDPENPAERNSFIIEDVSAPLVLCHTHYASRFGDKARVVEPFISEVNLPTEGITNLGLDIGIDQRAYLVYTSGSTGKPKGVVLDHSAATCGISNFRAPPGLRSLLFYNPIFSAAQRTILATIIHGGCLCLANRKTMASSLARIINEMGVTAIGVTSSTASLLNPDQVPGLKQVGLTGEMIDPNVVAVWATKVQVRNAYGLSECTQINMGRQLEAGSNARIVGRPQDTTSSYVLIPGTTKLAPLLVQGELCLGGHQLGREYLNRPELTEKAFIPNPFGSGRLYRTGDRAICHEDGSIEILGRIDYQVKINGQRVEPAEVAAVLQTHAQVSAAGVIGATIAGRKCLVACIVPEPSILQHDIPSFIDRVRKHASEQLPIYMMPSYYLPLETLPRNANGKLDIAGARRRVEELGRDGLLAAIRPNGPTVDEASVSPHMAILKRLVAATLNIPVETVTPSSSFLLLGGSSLEAIRISIEALKEGLQVEAGDIIRSDNFESLLKNVSTSEFKGDPEPFSLLKDKPNFIKNMKDVVDAFPVTAMQEGVLASLLQNDTRYIYQRAYDASGLNGIRLKNALQTVLDQRPILRTTFVEHGDSFLQIVQKNVELSWEEHAMGVAEYKAFDHKRSMQFGDTFFRVALLNSKVLVVSMHHALFDYWSHRFFYEDVASVYLGHTLVPRAPFSRFVSEAVHSNSKEDEQFWTAYLENVHPTVITGTDEAHSIVKRIKVDFQSMKAKHGLTTGPAIYAAWAMVLGKHTNSEDVVFATTLSGRDRAVIDIENLDGPTLTTVPQRIPLDPTTSLSKLVKSVQDGLWEMSKHAQYGMRGALRAARQGNVKLFDTMVNYLTPEVTNPAVQEVFKPHGAKNIWQSEFQTLELQEIVPGQEFSVSFTSGLNKNRASFILDQFEKALNLIAERPDTTVADAKLISEREKEFLLSLCPQTVFPEPSFLHGKFESYARTEPERPAIQWLDQETISYRELDRRANRLAHYLRQFIIPGDIVALLLDKSPMTIVSILGVMKAGGAYVPLSPENPSERNNFIIDDVHSKVLLTESHHGFVVTGTAMAVNIDQLDVSAFPDVTPEIAGHSTSDPAYVIYTSGSTGQPKGVVMPHAPAAAAVSSMVIAERRFEGEWRTLQFANYVFDASVEDIFNTLSSGGCLCMAPTSMMLSDLPSVVALMKVKQAILTPTVARLMTPDQVPTMTRLMLGGEPMTSDLITEWTKTTSLLNVYGPTETAMVITTKELSAGDDPKNIGRPFATASAFILDVNNTDLVPYGAVGELCFGGSQLSAGYHNREDLTSKAYVMFNGQRIYRTGDLARWLPNGEIECLGRKDNQVKINGHRVELPEIENAIIKTSEVVEATVVVVQSNGKPQLVALCVFKSGDSEVFLDPEPFSDSVAAVKDKLTTLTPYMIPKFWIPMETFPKLPSRKTDRKKLVAMVQKLETAELSQYAPGSSSNEAVIPVETAEEAILQRLWAGQFNLEPEALGRNSNFMFLGADSISAIKLVGQCRKEGYKLEVSQVLDNLVLSDMAACMTKIDVGVSQKQFVVNESAYEAMQAGGVNKDAIDDILPSPPGQIEFLRQGQREDQFWNLMTIRALPAEIDIDQWLETTTELTRRNGLLRSTFIDTPEHGWLMVTLRDPTLDWETIHTTPEEKQTIVESVWSQRFEFGKPFIRYKLLVYPDGNRDLLIKLDHALYDGQLLRVFDEQFLAITKNDDLPAPASTYKDFALSVWQTPKESVLDFWSDLLSGCEYVYPPVAAPKITAVKVKPANHNLDGIAKTFSVTVPIVFQSAFQLWLSKLSASKDIMFDLLVAGRNVNGLEDADKINGTCANFLPFRSRFSAGDSVGDYMKATQSLFWKTGENAVVGLSDIYSHLQLDRAAHTSRVLFLYQPFEPAKGPVNHNRWLVMAMSQVRMYQPYAIVIEVFKTHAGHNLKLYYDDTVYTAVDAEAWAADINSILDNMVGHPDARLAEMVDA